MAQCIVASKASQQSPYDLEQCLSMVHRWHRWSWIMITFSWWFWETGQQILTILALCYIISMAKLRSGIHEQWLRNQINGITKIEITGWHFKLCPRWYSKHCHTIMDNISYLPLTLILWMRQKKSQLFMTNLITE